MRNYFRSVSAYAALLSGMALTASPASMNATNTLAANAFTMKRGIHHATYGGNKGYRAGMKAKAIHTAKRRRIRAGRHF